MATIYLTGALSEDWDNDPFEWMDTLGDDYRDQEFINPYCLNDFELGDDDVYERPDLVVEPALEKIEEVDGMLVRWEDGAFLVGTAMEMFYAWQHDIPIAVWYEGYRDNLSPWIKHTTKGTWSDRDKALKIILSYADGSYHITG